MSQLTANNLFGHKVGILGGGQLARMLCLEGHKLGLEMHILSDQPSDPAAQVTRHWHQGRIDNTENVRSFFSKVDVVTIESEFVDEQILLAAEAHSGKTTHPPIRLIAELSDRLKQKAWLERHRIPTAPFSGLIQGADVESFYKAHHKTGIVIKKRRFGYDGLGTFILKNKNQVQNWLSEHSHTLSDYMIEEFIPFKRELAVQISINRFGHIVFPLVEWQAEDSKCLWVKGPTSAKGFTPMLNTILSALKKSQFVGTIAFEFFETKSNKLSNNILVNEVAPRVHNSGHHTLETCAPNQFSAHLLAILDKKLSTGSPLKSKGFAMYNLIGASETEPQLKPPTQDVFLHWYGKNKNRLGRKMGHLTTFSDSANKALKILKSEQKKVKL